MPPTQPEKRTLGNLYTAASTGRANRGQVVSGLQSSLYRMASHPSTHGARVDAVKQSLSAYGANNHASALKSLRKASN